MARGYKARDGELEAALVTAEIGSAEQLAERAALSRSAAQRVMRGDLVTFATVMAVAKYLDGLPGADARSASWLFERGTE